MICRGERPAHTKLHDEGSWAIDLEQRCRLAFRQGIRDDEERSGRPLTAEQLRRALARYLVAQPTPQRPNERR